MSSAKGAEHEGRARKLLEQQGYLVHRSTRTPVLRGGRIIASNPNDIWHAFDLLAVGGPPGVIARMRCVQVTVLDTVGKRQKKVLPVARRFPPERDVVTAEVWGWVGGRRGLDPLGREKPAQCFQVWVWDGPAGDWVRGPVEWWTAEMAAGGPKDTEEV